MVALTSLNLYKYQQLLDVNQSFIFRLLKTNYLAKDYINSSNFDSLTPLKLDPNKADPVIDISRIDLNKDLNMATSALEFFIISLSKHLSLTPKQVIINIYTNYPFN